MSNIILIGLVVLLTILLIANLGLAITVIMKMRGRGEAPVAYSWNRPFIRGWQYEDLRPLMLLWTAVMLGVGLAGCLLLVGIFMGK